MQISFINLNSQEKAVQANRLLNWYDQDSVDYPWRKDWRTFNSPYHVWLSEIMLQQTTIAAVLPKYRRFVSELPTIEDVALASEDKIRELVQGLGYYRRFSFFHKAAAVIVSQGCWPTSYQEWLKVPGIGPYTAAAIASITLNEATAVVDGNVERVLSRLFAIPGPVNTPGKKQIYTNLANHLITTKRPGDFNQGLMQLGQLICTPTKPECGSCPVTEFCVARKFDLQSEIPAPKEQKQKVNVQLRLLVQRDKENVLTIMRSPSAKFLRGQSGFPTFIKSETVWHLDGRPEIKLTDAHCQTLGKFKHNITHHDISLEVVSISRVLNLPDTFALATADIRKNLIASLDLKALKYF